ncbi:MAG: hypothetical protein ACM3MK_09695 [Chitinophagales bacterium]
MNDEIKDRLIKELQGSIPVVTEPYCLLAEKTGCSEEELLETINDMLLSGELRRFGAILRHQEAGFNTNAMIAWYVSPEDCDRVGEILASQPEVSHCYLRQAIPEWPYNIFSMVHARSDKELEDVIKRLSESSGINDYQVLSSQKELKKTSLQFR